jgi:hypothetical protein
MPSWNVFKELNPGKHLFIHSADDIGLLGALNDAAGEKELDVELLDVGLAIKNIDNLQEDEYNDLIELIDDFEEKKLGATLGRARRGARGVFTAFDPDAIDADGDRLVQEGTLFERPDARIRKPDARIRKPALARMMPGVPQEEPKPAREPVPIPEREPQKPRVPQPPIPAPQPVRPTPVRPRVPVGRDRRRRPPMRMMPGVPQEEPKPAKEPVPIPEREPQKPRVPQPPIPVPQPVRPTPVRPRVPVGLTGGMGRPGRSPREIFESRMNLNERLDETARRLKMSRKRVRQMELKYINQLRKRESLAQKFHEALLKRDSLAARGLDDDTAAMFWQTEDALRGEWMPSTPEKDGFSYTHKDMINAMRAQAKVMLREYNDPEAAELFRQAADLHEQVVSDGSYTTFRKVDPKINRARGMRQNTPKRYMPELDKFRK